MGKIFKYVVADILKNRILLVYTGFLLLASFSIFNLEDTAAKGILSMMNIVLWIVPLISLIFSTIYVYNSSEFIELLLSQPLKRRSIWLSFFAGLACSLCVAFFVGAGIMILLFAADITGVFLLVCGLFLSVIFAAIAMLAVVLTRDKSRGIGAAILLWLYFTVLFDGLVLFFLFQFADYPIEKTLIALSGMNPIDLSRILILLKLDVSAMLGYTGAIFKDFFGTMTGMLVSFAALCSWTFIPLWISLKRFNKKDL